MKIAQLLCLFALLLSACSSTDCYYGEMPNPYLVDEQGKPVLDKNTGQPMKNPEYENALKCMR